jgi:hypothetical protein
MAKREDRPSKQYRYEHYDPRSQEPGTPGDSSDNPSQQYRYEHYDPRSGTVEDVPGMPSPTDPKE